MPSDRNFRWMYLADAVSLASLMVLITIARFGFSWPSYPRWQYLAGFAVALSVHLLVAYFGGLYDREHRLGNPSRLAKVMKVTALAVLIDSTLSLGSSKYVMPRLNLIAFAILASLTLAFNRWLAQRVRTARFGRPQVLLVGTPDDLELADDHLRMSDRDATVVGRVTDIDGLETAVSETGATDVLLLSSVELSRIYPDPLDELERRRVGVYHRLAPADTLLGVSKSRQIAGMPFIALHSHALPESKLHFKRLLDLLYVTLALPVLIPVFAIVLGYARLFAGRRIFFRQERVGRYGESFTMVKLRTMYLDAEEDTGPVLADRDDPRVIPALAWMRSTRIDELPQLWNVVRADMSLVGPRPERPELVDQFEQLWPGYQRRHEMAPGITGLAQVYGRYHTDAGFKLGYDLQYLVNWSPILDLQILLRSLLVMARRDV